MQWSADHAFAAHNKPQAAPIGCKEHHFHSFAAAADRLAAHQLLAAYLSCSGKHCPEPTSFTALFISAGVSCTATSRTQKLHLSWPVDAESGLKPENSELGGSTRSLRRDDLCF